LSATSPLAETMELGNLLGRRLKERRRELGKTMAEVAAAAAVSVGYVSSIEKGGSLPLLPVLARLAHALDMSLAEVLRSSASSRVTEGHLDETLGKTRLSPETSRVQIVRLTVKPGGSGRSPVGLGGTDVFVYVYRGRFAVEVDGETYELEPGDALHCAVPEAIRWAVAGEERAVTLWLAAKAG